MEQNFKNYKAFDYAIKTRKKMNDVDLSYVPRFLLVSVITDKTYEYVEKEKKLYAEFNKSMKMCKEIYNALKS